VEGTAFGALALCSFVMSATPGPNNLMPASSGLGFRSRRTLATVAI